ncbi:hypothetical protein [Halostella salina]|uniref:hypothetical protein n=1 Tax=Halostella salina TaxID=1547897 RepID=UPI000EF7C5A2|nr:hypothetical protein [Halostella salina]
MRQDSDDDRIERNRSGRRRVLVSIGTAAAVGLAGCSGDDGTSDGGPGVDALGTDDGGTDSGSSDGDTQSLDGGDDGESAEGVSPATCSDLTSGYTALNPGDRPLTFRCERPEALSDLTYTSPPGFNVKMRPQNASDADYPKLLEITQTALHQGQSEEPYEPGADEEDVTTVEFEYAGETLQASVGAFENNTVRALTRLPYEFERGKRYVNTLILLRVFVEANDGSLGEECAPNAEEAVRHVIGSLEPNPETTVQSATEEYN